MGSARTTPGMRGRTSRRRAEQTVLGPAADAPPGQLALGLATEPPRTRVEPRPGVVHVPDWLDLDAQQALVAEFRAWAQPPAGLRSPRVPTGHLMSTQAVCLGWHWYPYAYSRTADDTDGAPVKPLPPSIDELARAAVATAYGTDSAEARSFAPDAAIVNLYPDGAKLGLHQDGEEPSDAPVVTISLGDTCTFRFADIDRRVGPFLDLELRSGDLLVFGREQRRVFHGVPKVFPRSAPARLGLPAGRLSITVRETGFSPTVD
jgi:alkylated DNA repair protein (DNA oxidative demethylase)